jgi:chromosome segregation ATPase
MGVEIKDSVFVDNRAEGAVLRQLRELKEQMSKTDEMLSRLGARLKSVRAVRPEVAGDVSELAEAGSELASELASLVIREKGRQHTLGTIDAELEL